MMHLEVREALDNKKLVVFFGDATIEFPLMGLIQSELLADELEDAVERLRKTHKRCEEG